MSKEEWIYQVSPERTADGRIIFDKPQNLRRKNSNRVRRHSSSGPHVSDDEEDSVSGRVHWTEHCKIKLGLRTRTGKRYQHHAHQYRVFSTENERECNDTCRFITCIFIFINRSQNWMVSELHVCQTSLSNPNDYGE